MERYTTYKKKGQWHTRCETVLYITNQTAEDTTPQDLLAHVRGHWRIEHSHRLRSLDCGARCRRCSEAWPAQTCNKCNALRGDDDRLIMNLPARTTTMSYLGWTLPSEKLRDVIWKEDKSLIRTGNAPSSGLPSPTSSSPSSVYSE